MNLQDNWNLIDTDQPDIHNKVPFKICIILTDAGEMFGGGFVEHVKRHCAHYGLTTLHLRKQEEVVAKVFPPYNPTYKGVIEKHFGSLDASCLKQNLEEDSESEGEEADTRTGRTR